MAFAPVVYDAPPVFAPEYAAPLMYTPPLVSHIPVAPVVPDPAVNAIIDEGDEYDEEYWKYSKFALPWLVFALALLICVFCLTFWQQAGDIKRWFDGVPRVLVRKSVADSNDEGGLPKNLRNLRIAAFSLIIAGSLLAFLIFILRLKPKIRLAVCIFLAVLLFAGGVIAWVAFGIGLDHENEAVQCPENWRNTRAHCRRRTNYAIVLIALDAAMGTFGIISAILLAFNSRYHWKLAPRSLEEEEIDRIREPTKERIPGEMVHKNVSFVRKWLTGLALFAALISAIASIVFVIILSEDSDVDFLRGPRGRADRSRGTTTTSPFEHAGWPRINTSIRYAGTAVGILAIFFNFMPFRSKTLAIIFGFLYFVSASLLLICFGFDVHELRRVRSWDCPRQFDNAELECHKNPFIATVVIEFITVVVLLLYLIVEYFIHGCRWNS